jgi:sulfate adenylyltransferase
MPEGVGMLVSPHGGSLVDGQLSPRDVQRKDAQLTDLPRVHLDSEQSFDAARIAEGAFSPLTGFMDHATIQSVMVSGRLPSGVAWPIPIFLSPAGCRNAATIARLRPGDEVALVDPAGGFFATLRLEEMFPIDRMTLAIGTYGTTDPSHPNVAALRATGDTVLAGQVELLRPPVSPAPAAELTPRTARALFQSRGWEHIAAYQTRNVPHTAHEHLQRAALERDDVDGLFIHPLVGPPKAGDYRPDLVLAAHEALVAQYYAADRVVLSPLTLSMRYAGPKAALFFAIIRKNFGCSHYIVGRDQAGVGNYYEPYACHRIFDEFPIGVVPLRYRELFYCPRCGGMASDKSCGHDPALRVGTSQTRMRRAIAANEPLPVDILRPEVAALLGRGGSPFVGAPEPPHPPSEHLGLEAGPLPPMAGRALG